MNSLFVALALALTPGLSYAGELDGKTFCRVVKRDGMFGQPAGEGEHCVSFKDDVVTDNADTFFGNPPENLGYVLIGGKILVVSNGSLRSPYSINNDQTQIANGAGAVLTLSTKHN